MLHDPLFWLASVVIVTIISLYVHSARTRTKRRIVLSDDWAEKQQAEADAEADRVAATAEADRIRRAEGARDDRGGAKARAGLRLKIERSLKIPRRGKKK